MDLDLDISNYSLDDILNLFNVDKNFNNDDLANAKKIVLKMHPDKSKLDKEYFIFFLKAYKLLYKVYEFKNKAEQEDEDYDTGLIDEDLENKEVWQLLSKDDNFNEIFNEMFERNNFHNKNDGYDDWLKEDNIKYGEANNMSEVNKIIKEEKQNLRQLINIDEIQDYKTNMGSLLVDNQGNYGSDMFSKLKYDDVKTVYTESVIPVTDEDYKSRKQYSSIGEFRVDRDGLLNEKIGNMEYLQKQKDKKENEDNIQRAYELAREEETMRSIKNNMASTLHRLK